MTLLPLSGTLHVVYVIIFINILNIVSSSINFLDDINNRCPTDIIYVPTT